MKGFVRQQVSNFILMRQVGSLDNKCKLLLAVFCTCRYDTTYLYQQSDGFVYGCPANAMLLTYMQPKVFNTADFLCFANGADDDTALMTDKIALVSQLCQYVVYTILHRNLMGRNFCLLEDLSKFFESLLCGLNDDVFLFFSLRDIV